MYSPLIKKGGIIALHDIAPKGNPEFSGGVPIFWQEVKKHYKIKEFIENVDQDSFGLGIIYY